MIVLFSFFNINLIFFIFHSNINYFLNNYIHLLMNDLIKMNIQLLIIMNNE